MFFNGSPRPRLNWQLHFGEPPKWTAGVRFILVDVEPVAGDAARAAVVLRGDAAAVARQLSASLGAAGAGSFADWTAELTERVRPAACPSVCLSNLTLQETEK
jgi:hypothetical protein